MSPRTNASQQYNSRGFKRMKYLHISWPQHCVWLFENCCQNSLEKKGLGHYGHHGDTPEYHVFHVEFERVEIPFIIALWIFVSSLAKIGKYGILLS